MTGMGEALENGKETSHSAHANGKEKKVKVTLVQGLRLCTGRTVYKGSRDIVLLFHDHGTRRG
jgi:hypothetical protein